MRDVMFFATLIGVFLTATVIVVDMKKPRARNEGGAFENFYSLPAWRGAGFADADFLEPQSVFQFGVAQCAARSDRKRFVHAERRHAQYCRWFARTGALEILLFAQHCRQSARLAG